MSSTNDVAILRYNDSKQNRGCTLQIVVENVGILTTEIYIARLAKTDNKAQKVYAKCKMRLVLRRLAPQSCLIVWRIMLQKYFTYAWQWMLCDVLHATVICENKITTRFSVNSVGLTTQIVFHLI